jgi:hypothetical protein
MIQLNKENHLMEFESQLLFRNLIHFEVLEQLMNQ